MKILVLGGGVIGVTSAWYLAQAGHEVTLLDRQPGVGQETSYSNAGEISPGFATPWAEPGVPLKILKWLLQKHGPFYLTSLNPALLRWLLRMVRECSGQRFAVNAARMMPLAAYSLRALQELRVATGIAYEERQRGLLNLHRNAAQLRSARNDIAFLEQYRVPYRLLDREECVAYEPALAASRAKIGGALLFSGDETGDCFLFSQGLAALAAANGVSFRFNATIREFAAEKGRIRHLLTDQGELTADAYVVALGSYSPLLLRSLGIRLPVYPVKGYAMTFPLLDESKAPQGGILDETHKVGITRFERRIRVGGIAELAGYDLRLRAARRRTLEFIVEDLFPGAADCANAEFWCGLRPMTPDGTPVIGATSYENLFINTGHGTLGWTMACGSARVLADLISGRQPEIDASGLALARYR